MLASVVTSHNESTNLNGKLPRPCSISALAVISYYEIPTLGCLSVDHSHALLRASLPNFKEKQIVTLSLA